MKGRLALIAAAIAALVVLAPKDCVIGERIPGPEESSCASIVGVEWASRSTAYVVMAGITLLLLAAVAWRSRRSRRATRGG